MLRVEQSRTRSWFIVLTLLMLVLPGCVVDHGSGVGQNSRAAEINVRLGIGYMQKGNLALADRKLKRALKQDPDLSLVQWTNALLEEKLGNQKKAEIHYKKAVRLNKQDSEAYNNYGAFLCRQGRVEEALSAFESAVSNPLYATKDYAYTNAGICLAENGRDDDAKAYFIQALDENSVSAPANYQLALLYYNQSRYQQSSLIRKRIEGKAVSSPHVLWLCAVTERNLNNTVAADKCARKLLTNYPASKQADQLNTGI